MDTFSVLLENLCSVVSVINLIDLLPFRVLSISSVK